MKKFLLVSPKNRTVYNFRGDLIKAILSQGFEVVVTGPNRDNIDQIEALGVRFVEIPMNKNGVSVVADLKYVNALRKLMTLEKPDAMLGYTIKPVIYGAIAARLAGVKSRTSMVTGVGYLFTAKTLKARMLRFVATILYRIGLSCADRVIFQNEDDRDEFVENGIVKSKKTRIVNGSGVNMSRFARTALPQNITFFMLSRALKSKGVREYLEAARIVKKQFPKVEFMYLGAVEKMQDALTCDYVQSFIDDGTITYYPETNEVPAYMAKCSVFVLPSYREGTPRTVLEAMAMGRPIITSDAPGCRSTVKNGETGWLTRVQDVDDVAAKMIWFIENQNKINEMGESSYRYCKEKFDVNVVNDSMLMIMGI